MFDAYLLQLKKDLHFKAIFNIGKMFDLYVCKMVDRKFLKVSGLEQVCVADYLIHLWKNAQYILVVAQRTIFTSG